MLVSSTEPFNFKHLGQSSTVPERYGCDFLIVKGKAKTGVQRKKFPEDLMASLADGRLYEQVLAMGKLDRAIIVFEGFGKWTNDGELMVNYGRMTKKQMYGLIASLAFEFGIEVIILRGMSDTIEFLEVLEDWAGKEKHQSLRTRPGPAKDSWGRTGIREIGIHLLQSFPGVGPELAGRVYDHFQGVPMRWEFDGPEKLMEISGIGKAKAKTLYESLERVRVSEVQ